MDSKGHTEAGAPFSSQMLLPVHRATLAGCNALPSFPSHSSNCCLLVLYLGLVSSEASCSSILHLNTSPPGLRDSQPWKAATYPLSGTWLSRDKTSLLSTLQVINPVISNLLHPVCLGSGPPKTQELIFCEEALTTLPSAAGSEGPELWV